jgi:hypothetical protein
MNTNNSFRGWISRWIERCICIWGIAVLLWLALDFAAAKGWLPVSLSKAILGATGGGIYGRGGTDPLS